MNISSINFNSFNISNNKKLPDYRLFIQKTDVVSFSGKKMFSYTEKGILQTAIDECENKETVESLIKNEEGLYKYRPFTVFEILTQKDKPNFAENLKALQEFKIGNNQIPIDYISRMLAACDGQNVKSRLDILTTISEGKGIKLPIELFCTDNNKFETIKKYLEEINDSNKDKIISKCLGIAKPDEISKPIKYLSKDERFFYSIFGKPKSQKDDLEKLIESGKYKNISKNALKKYKEDHFENYIELYKKSKSMPQILDLINHIVGLGQHSKYKEAWIRKTLKDSYNFEYTANIFLQKESPAFHTEKEVLRKLLFGEQRPELKKRIREFKKRTGIHLFADSNIPISYIDRFEKIIPDLKNHYTGNCEIANADITSIIDKNSDGFCINSGITLSPIKSGFEETVFHEYAHVAHKHSIPYGDKENHNLQDAWKNLGNKKFYPQDSVEYKTTISQLRNYATKNFAEFVAVLNEQIGVGKFEVVINDKGEKVLRKYLKDGDNTTAKDLEILMNIYESVYGPDIGAKKATDSSSKYVETPFKGAPKFNLVEYMCNKAKDD